MADFIHNFSDYHRSSVPSIQAYSGVGASLPGSVPAVNSVNNTTVAANPSAPRVTISESKAYDSIGRALDAVSGPTYNSYSGVGSALDTVTDAYGVVSNAYDQGRAALNAMTRDVLGNPVTDAVGDFATGYGRFGLVGGLANTAFGLTGLDEGISAGLKSAIGQQGVNALTGAATGLGYGGMFGPLGALAGLVGGGLYGAFSTPDTPGRALGQAYSGGPVSIGQTAAGQGFMDRTGNISIGMPRGISAIGQTALGSRLGYGIQAGPDQGFGMDVGAYDVGGYTNQRAQAQAERESQARAAEAASQAQSSQGGSQKSGGDKSVICTELHRQGLISDAELSFSAAFAKHCLSKQTMRGYYVWGIPAAKLMRKSKIATKLAKALFYSRHNATLGKFAPVGWLIRLVGEGCCWALGAFVKQETSDMMIKEFTEEAN